MLVLDVLRPVSFGQRVAEDEGDQLAEYFVETDHWHRLLSDHVDIVYGPKGSGKSALYNLLVARESSLFDQNVLLAPAENPRGAPAFRALVTDPPASEIEFIALWKLYFACLASSKLDEYGVPGESAEKLRTILEDNNLKLKDRNLQAILQSAFDYVKKLLRPSAVESGVKLDPITQQPSGVTFKIIFNEPSTKESTKGIISVDELLHLVEKTLENSKYRLWILMDRLDVAFSDSAKLETNALRALFHVYLDLLGFNNIRLKIFLRTDIWRSITTSGFREASHITRHLTIEWNSASLLNLIARRAAQNTSILQYFELTRTEVLADAESQKYFFYKIFPDQVEVGSRKPYTLDWMISRIRDGTRQPAPRELIHFLNSLRDVQVRSLEVGDPDPEGGRLFSRAVFKEALPEVSRVRLHQTLYAEYPEYREFIESLRGENTQHSVKSLAKIWKKSDDETQKIAQMLVEVGFMEVRGEKDQPTYWIPILYRDALELVQGAAE